MNTSNPRLLTLSLAIIATLAACKKAGDAPVAATPSEPQATPLTLDESKLPKPSTFSAADLDPGKAACGDFNEYVNGKWVAANPIPGDRFSWGVSEILGERSLAIQRQLAEQAAADKDATGVEKIIGDFWATGMDEAKIEAQGIAPIQSQLDAIDGLNDTAAIAGYIRKQAAIGDNPIFDFDAEADFKQSSMNIAYASQGGLGLPDKTYYFDADKRDVLEAYRAHIAKVLELSGATAADAAEQARAVVAFETRLAKASLSEEDLHDVSLYYNPVSLADADKLTPNFSWTEFFKSQDVAAPAMFSLPMPAFHQEVSKMLARYRPGRLAQLPALPRRRWRRAVPERQVRAGEFQLLLQDPVRAEGNQAALEARAGHAQRRCRRSDGPAVRQGRLPRGFQGAHGNAGRQPAHRAEGTHREPGLDERRDQEEGHRQVGNLHPEDRLPGQVA